ncbi:hypothetical protein E5226_02585 [Cellulomonas shaoxiangyii]|nr:hypothetical protein E5226_02585 [Cellulomonas shaoxiangyii]
MARAATPPSGSVLGAVRDAGENLRRLRLPLVILVLVLVALLGAALADRVVGADGASGVTSTARATGADAADQYPRADAPGAMITAERRAARATTDPAGRDPGHPPVPRSTEVKDA